MVTAKERTIRNAPKLGASGEVNSKEGKAPTELSLFAPPNCREVVTPKEELNGAVGEALVPQPLPQRPRTKLIFDVRIDDDCLD